jgi:iron complex transport system permease protein
LSRTSRITLVAGLSALVVVLAVISLSAGQVWVPFSAWAEAAHDPRWPIIFELRLPRTILGIATGIALGMSGAALQGYTRNALADPAVLGISSMASLGAVLTLYVVYLDIVPDAAWLLPTGAMAGSFAGVVLLLAMSGTASSMLTFILAGVILNLMAGAGVALSLNLAPNPWAVSEIVNWLMGSIADRGAPEVEFALPFIAAGCVLLIVTARALDALTLGDLGARSLGVNLGLTRLLLALGIALAVGASVAVTGVIGFVGLVTPHLMRPFVGARPGALLVPSALAGAIVVLIADIAVRLIPSVTEVKLGVVMAAVGGPFFLALLLRERRRLA